MTTLIETLALALLLGTAILTYEGTTTYSDYSELCSEPGGVTHYPPPPVD